LSARTPTQIHIAQSNDLLSWTLGPLFIAKTLWGNPNVEAGPPPMKLADGNYVFFHNRSGPPCLSCLAFPHFLVSRTALGCLLAC
jgi:hypothetical protein